MEYQKIINLLDDTTNQSNRFRTIIWVEIKDKSKIKYDNIRFKPLMTRSSLCDYSDAYILVKGTITVPNTIAAGAAVNNTNKEVIFRNYAPFNICTTEINNT